MEEYEKQVPQTFLMKYKNQAKKSYNYYIEKYDAKVRDFIDYIDNVATHEKQQSKTQDIFIKFYLNELEINLASAFMCIISEDFNWLLEPKNYLFLLTECYFIAGCKKIFNNIENPEELINYYTNLIYPKISSILLRFNNQTANTVLQPDLSWRAGVGISSSASSSSAHAQESTWKAIVGTTLVGSSIASFGSFFRNTPSSEENITISISDFRKKCKAFIEIMFKGDENDTKTRTFINYLKSANEIRELFEIFKKFTNENELKVLLNGLEESINFRKELRSYYQKSLEKEEPNYLKEDIQDSEEFEQEIAEHTEFLTKIISEELEKDNNEADSKEVKRILSKSLEDLEFGSETFALEDSFVNQLSLTYKK